MPDGGQDDDADGGDGGQQQQQQEGATNEPDQLDADYPLPLSPDTVGFCHYFTRRRFAGKELEPSAAMMNGSVLAKYTPPSGSAANPKNATLLLGHRRKCLRGTVQRRGGVLLPVFEQCAMADVTALRDVKNGLEDYDGLSQAVVYPGVELTFELEPVVVVASVVLSGELAFLPAVSLQFGAKEPPYTIAVGDVYREQRGPKKGGKSPHRSFV